MANLSSSPRKNHIAIKFPSREADLDHIKTLFQLDSDFNPIAKISNLTRESQETYSRCLSPFSQAIIMDDNFQRLQGISQMIAKFTCRQTSQTGSRHQHSLQVAILAKHFASFYVGRKAQARFISANLNLPALAEAVGLLHDIAHPPFNHTGEEIVRKCLGDRSFDHDQQAKVLILNSSLGATLKKHNLDPEIIARVIAEDKNWFAERKQEVIFNVLFSIKEMSDRLAYLVSDILSDQKMHPEVFNFGILNQVIESLAFKSNGLVLPDAQAHLLSDLRFQHFYNNTYDSFVLLAKEILISECTRLRNTGQLDKKKFINSSEYEMLDLFDEIVRDHLISGLEMHYQRVLEIKLNQIFAPESSFNVQNISNLPSKIYNYLQDNDLPCHIVIEPNMHKRLSYISMESGRERFIDSGIEDFDRRLIVFAPMDYDISAEKIKQIKNLLKSEECT